MRLSVVLCISFVLICYILFPSYIKAAGSGLEVNPALMEILLTKSDITKQVPFSYTNHTERKLQINFNLYNYRQQTISGYTQVFDKDGKSSPSTLIKNASVTSTSVIVKPGEKKDVILTINNTSELSPGGHYAALVAEVVPEEQLDESSSVVSSAVSSLILLRKEGGEKFNYTLKSIDWPKNKVEFSFPSQINMLFENKGNTHIIPYGKIEVYDSFNRLIYKGIINTPSSFLLPGVERSVPTILYGVESSYPVSFNRVVIDVTDSLKTKDFNFETQYIYVNLKVIVAGAALIVGIILTFVKLLSKKRK